MALTKMTCATMVIMLMACLAGTVAARDLKQDPLAALSASAANTINNADSNIAALGDNTGTDFGSTGTSFGSTGTSFGNTGLGTGFSGSSQDLNQMFADTQAVLNTAMNGINTASDSQAVMNAALNDGTLAAADSPSIDTTPVALPEASPAASSTTTGGGDPTAGMDMPAAVAGDSSPMPADKATTTLPMKASNTAETAPAKTTAAAPSSTSPSGVSTTVQPPKSSAAGVSMSVLLAALPAVLVVLAA